MATRTASARKLDVASSLRSGLAQFRDLNPNQPGQWPILPRLTVWAVVMVIVVVAGWFVWLSDQSDALQAARDKEPQLKAEYRNKLAQAINLDALKRQKVEVEGYVTQLEKQLPGRAEMDALLSEINAAGGGSGLVMEQFVPGNTETKDYYAELPIAIRVTGRYHDIGNFAADVAALSRIVTLHNLNIAPTPGPNPNNTLTMEATARTYRYLDPAEVAEVKRAQSGAKK